MRAEQPPGLDAHNFRVVGHHDHGLFRSLHLFCRRPAGRGERLTLRFLGRLTLGFPDDRRLNGEALFFLQAKGFLDGLAFSVEASGLRGRLAFAFTACCFFGGQALGLPAGGFRGGQALGLTAGRLVEGQTLGLTAGKP